MTPLAKPDFGNPCNGCGMCCIREVCDIGLMIYGDAQPAPCPALVRKDGRFWCKVVLVEEAQGLPPIAAEALGIGFGCDTVDGVAPLTQEELPA